MVALPKKEDSPQRAPCEEFKDVDSRSWEICEKSFDNRETGQLEVESLRVEWHKAFSKKEVDEALLEGLERRAMMLLEAGDSEWSDLLDNEDFWKAGWGSKVDD